MTKYKISITILSIVIIIIIGFITYQAINYSKETTFVLDFNNKHHIISSYAGLIGSLLSFLSIMFILYKLIEDKHQIQNEKDEKEQNIQKGYFNKLKVINNFLDSIIKNIHSLRDNILEFSDNEISQPSIMNNTYFPVNKNLRRITELDMTETFKVFEHFFSNDNNWEKNYTDLFKFTDFYGEFIPLTMKIYEDHIKNKEKNMLMISSKLNDLSTICQRLIDFYRHHNQTNNPYCVIAVNFNTNIYKYYEDCEKSDTDQNTKRIVDEYVIPLIKGIQMLRNDFIFKTELLELASNIKKEQWKLEKEASTFGYQLKRQWEKYFSQESQNLKDLISIKEIIQFKITEKSNT